MSKIVEQRRDLGRELEKLIKKHFSLSERPSFVLTFALPIDLKNINYVANTSREQGIELLETTKLALQGRLN